MKHNIHTPEGMRDIIGRECDKKRFLERKIEKKFRSFGYQSIETPSIEFLNVFSPEVGTTPQRELYRFFDAEGETLVLRPDFTPAVARMVSMYFAEDDSPLRFCYHGRVFRKAGRLQGRLRELTQMGVELVGEDSPEADAEIIALIVSILDEVGLPDYQVTIGHVDYFQALADEAELDEETRDELRELLSVQNRFGAQELVDRLRLRKDLKQTFITIPELFGDGSVLERARSLTENRRARAACDRLIQIRKILALYCCEDRVAFDMGMLTQFRYYNGIFVQAFTYGTGDAIITGGRYDRLLEHFGKHAPSIGFATDVDALLFAMERQNVQIPIRDQKTMVLYPGRLEEIAVPFAQAHRNSGMDVACVRFESGKTLDDYRRYGARNQFGGIIYFHSDDEVYAIDLSTGVVERIETAESSVQTDPVSEQMQEKTADTDGEAKES